MVDLATPAFVGGHLLLVEIVLALALVMALSGLDDLFIDLVFVGQSLRRWLASLRGLYGYPSGQQPGQQPGFRPTLAALRQVAPAPMAIIIPAWDEAAVIGAMLTRLLKRIDYPSFHVFVGLYPNDPAGIAAVSAIDDARLSIVLCRRPGPTTKSDCLNHLWHAVVAHEATHGLCFKAVVLHDAEDVIHPQELWVQNGAMPAIAMVQLPVEPLPDAGSRWVSGHYLDEFAAGHVKDVVVRALLGAAVPSAGVACAIDRTMLGRIADDAGGDPFDPTCLTEDYELGLKINALGGVTALLRVRCPGEAGVVATQEHFPASFDTARRQKARWLLGIALAGWDRLGWPGGLADRYMLVRDRKAVAAALVTVFAYAVALLMIVDMAVRSLAFAEVPLPPLFGRVAATLAAINIAILAWRLAMRAACTTHIYGWREGARSVPRAIVSNVINAAAAWSALRRYLEMLRTGAAPVWDKTTHRFPASRAV